MMLAGFSPAARQPGPRPPDRAAHAAMQVADDRRRLIAGFPQPQCVLGGEIEAGQPDAGRGVAALAERLVEQVELGQRGIEAEPQQGEPALHLRGRSAAARPADPGDEVPHLRAEPAATASQVVLDGGRRRRQDRCRRHHRLPDRERPDPVQPGQQRARLLFEQPGGEAGGLHGGQIPSSTIRRPRRTHRPVVGRKPVSPG